MSSLKRKRENVYFSPSVKVTQAEPEGLICGSPVLYTPVEVDELHNINADKNAARNESFYFEF